MSKSIKKILKALTDLDCRTQSEIEYGLWLTVGIEELSKSLIEYIGDTCIRDNVIKHINKRVQNGEKLPLEFIRILLSEFNNSKKRRRISLGKVIMEFLPMLTKSEKKEFLNWQIMSEKVSDRKRAYKVAGCIYNEDIESKLLKVWNKYRDNNCMDVLARNAPPEKFVPYFEDIWGNEELRYGIRNKVLKKVASIQFSKVVFLKSENPIAYLSACVEACQEVSDDYALSVVQKSDKLSTLGYVFWCLGRLGKQELLLNICSGIDEIESKVSLEAWEHDLLLVKSMAESSDKPA